MHSQDSVGKVARAISTGTRKHAPRTKGTGALYMENVGKPNERAVATISRETLASYGFEVDRELKFRSRTVRVLGGNVSAAKKEASANADAKLDEIKAGRVTQLGRPAPTQAMVIVTVADWLKRWLEVNVRPTFDQHGNRIGGEQGATYDNYSWAVHKHILHPEYGLGKVKLAALMPSHVEDFMVAMRQRKVGPSSIHRTVVILGTGLQVAFLRHRETGLQSNPCRSIDNPKPRRAKKSPPDMALIEQLYQLAGDHLYAFSLDLGLRLGLRRSEMAGLRFKDFDLATNRIVLSGRVVRFRGAAISRSAGLKMRDERQEEEELLGADSLIWTPLLAAHRARVLQFYLLRSQAWTGPDPRDPDAFIFPSVRGGEIDPAYLTKWFGKLAQQAGAAKTLHGLRHDFVTMLLNDDVPLWKVSQLARHKTTAVTEQVYGHRDDKQKQALFLSAGDWLERARLNATG